MHYSLFVIVLCLLPLVCITKDVIEESNDVNKISNLRKYLIGASKVSTKDDENIDTERLRNILKDSSIASSQDTEQLRNLLKANPLSYLLKLGQQSNYTANLTNLAEALNRTGRGGYGEGYGWGGGGGGYGGGWGGGSKTTSVLILKSIRLKFNHYLSNVQSAIVPNIRITNYAVTLQ